MKKFVFVLFIVAFAVSFGQNKYMIYFKDKGSLSKQSLSKVSDKSRIANKYLSKKSIERRKKNLGDNYFTYDDLPIEKNYVASIQKEGIIISNKLKWFNAVTAFLTDEQFDIIKSKNFVEKIERIRKTKSIKPIEENPSTNNKLKKSPALHTYNYGSSISQNELSDIPTVHDMGITGEGVRIGVLDTGFDWNDAISINNENIIAEYDFVKNDGITEDQTDFEISDNSDFHGTAVLSILSGFSEGNLIGPAFGSKFVLAKTEWDSLGSESHSEEDNFAAALEWMDSIGVDITTASLGYSEFDTNEVSYTYEDMNGKTTIVTQAAELAFDRGISVINSAGNEGTAKWYYITAPGDGYNTITVGAVTPENILASFSSRGPTYDGRIKPELVAQGVSVLFESPISKISPFRFGNGTSFAAPITAGIAGLLLSAYPHLTNKQIRAIMIESGDNVDNPNNDIGYGLVSALRAVTFPNLKRNGNSFSINKIFDPAKNVDENSVEIVFSDGSSFAMVKNGNHFEANLPILTDNNNYQIYFRYNDSQGNSQREPVSKNYNFNYGTLYVDLVVTDVDSEKNIPDNFYLSQNYPNPFNPTTKIDFAIPSSASKTPVTLKVFDILGTEIRTLVQGNKSPGNYSVDFNATGLSSGIYFYQLQAGDFIQTRKLTILK